MSIANFRPTEPICLISIEMKVGTQEIVSKAKSMGDSHVVTGAMKYADTVVDQIIQDTLMSVGSFGLAIVEVAVTLIMEAMV